MTIQQRLVKALEARGGVKDVKRSTRKFLVYRLPSLTMANEVLYLGNAGALRVGANQRDSVPYDKLKKILLNEASP